MVSFYRILVLLLAMALAAQGCIAATAQEQDGGEHPDAAVVTAPVEVDGRVLFRVRGVSSYPAEQRAAAVAQRIEAIAVDPAVRPDSVRAVEADGYSNIMAGERRVMSVFDADARVEEVARKTLALAISERTGQAIEHYRRERTPDALLRHALHSAGATAILAAVVVLAIWLSRASSRVVERRYHSRIRALGIQSFEILRAERIWSALRTALTTLRILAIAVAVFLYLDYVLGGLPWTRGIANRLTEFILRPLKIMGETFVRDIPDLIFLLVLVLVVRFLLRLMKMFFDAVARGSVTLKGFEAEWSLPTYKILRVVVVIFALVVAYPYIPGSGSEAFKGVSLFLGVVISLGSSSAIANVIAGVMLTYRRAFRIGDRVQIGEVTGDVTEMRLQVTHLRTVKNEEVTIPNSAILNGQVVNFSTLAVKQGLILHTTVGIGYETPWRQVEAMLLIAADRTAGLLKEPAPFVQHTALGDFCVTYEINAYCSDAKAMNRLYTELHRNILDQFNEYGVQIMTPAYEGDPEQPKLVPKGQWYLAPAAPNRIEGTADAPKQT
jgi:small-conductance mechanosensitive channel